MKNLILFIVVNTCFLPQYWANKKDKLIQFSGVVVGSDSLKAVPFTSVIIKSDNRGTIADFFGFFSIVAQPNDSIEFSAIGYKKMQFVIPDTLTDNKYSLIQVLPKDTIYLKEAVIYPWPTKEQFKDAFLKLNIPNDDLERARKNLSAESMSELSQMMSMDANMNYIYQTQEQASRLYQAGQYPTSNWLNPIAWAKFIDAWRNGDFKKK